MSYTNEGNNKKHVGDSKDASTSLITGRKGGEERGQFIARKGRELLKTYFRTAGGEEFKPHVPEEHAKFPIGTNIIRSSISFKRCTVEQCDDAIPVMEDIAW